MFIKGVVMTKIDIEQNKALLKELIENDKDIRYLSKWVEKINIFDILKSSKTETKHSNLLAWLMTVDGNHQLGDAFVREFIKKVIKNNSEMKKDLFDWAFIDYSSQIVKTEDNDIDITIRFENLDSNNILVIENKTKSKEHNAGKSDTPQNLSYREYIENNYKDYKKLYVYLTPTGDQPEDAENWCILTYDDILDIIDSVISGKELLPQVKMLIDNYCDLIKKDVIGRNPDLYNDCNAVYDNHKEAIQLLFDYSKNNQFKNKDAELLKLCNKIYALYEDELDLIYQNKKDTTAQLVEELVKYINDTSDFEIAPSSGKSYVTFTSKALNSLIPLFDEDISSWGTKYSYQFWFYTVDYKNDKTIKLAFELGGNNTKVKNIYDIHKKIIDGIKPVNKNIDFKYKIKV